MKKTKTLKKVTLILVVMAMVVGMCFALTACGKDTAKIKIGAQAGTTGELYLKGDADMSFKGFGNVEPKPYDSIGLAVQDMINGNINYVVGDIEPAKAAVKSIAGAKVINVPLSTETYAIGVNKEDPALLAAINTKLAAMKLDGSLKAIIDNYNDTAYVPATVPGGTVDAGKNQLVLATNAEFAPFEYKIGNEFAGIDIEIAKVLAKEFNMELVILDMEFDSVVLSVGKNNVDIALAGLTVKESRKQVVSFSDGYFEGSYQVLIVKEGDTTFDGCTTKAQIEEKLKSL